MCTILSGFYIAKFELTLFIKKSQNDIYMGIKMAPSISQSPFLSIPVSQQFFQVLVSTANLKEYRRTGVSHLSLCDDF
jgi:hypothetical protein